MKRLSKAREHLTLENIDELQILLSLSEVILNMAAALQRIEQSTEVSSLLILRLQQTLISTNNLLTSSATKALSDVKEPLGLEFAELTAERLIRDLLPFFESTLNPSEALVEFLINIRSSLNERALLQSLLILSIPYELACALTESFNKMIKNPLGSFIIDVGLRQMLSTAAALSHKQITEEWRNLMGVKSVITGEEGQEKEKPVEVLLFDASNSDPMLETGIFSNEYCSLLAYEWDRCWGLDPYGEGFLKIPAGMTEERLSDDQRFDATDDQKIPRGYDDVDLLSRRIARNKGNMRRREEVEVEAKSQGYVPFWSPSSVRRYLKGMFYNKGFSIRVIRIEDSLAAWIISYEIDPRNKLHGRDILINGEPAGNITYIDTIGYGHKSRYTKEHGNIQELIREKIIRITNTLAKTSNKILLIRMNDRDRAVGAFALKAGGFLRATVSQRAADTTKIADDNEQYQLCSTIDENRQFWISFPNLRPLEDSKAAVIIKAAGTFIKKVINYQNARIEFTPAANLSNIIRIES